MTDKAASHRAGSGRKESAENQESDCPWRNLAADGGELSLEDFLTFRLGRLGNASQRLITTRYLESHGLKVPEWRMLAALAAFAPMPFSRLVQVSSSDKALVSRTLRQLVERGLAQTHTDPYHGRRIVCEITASGMEFYHRIMPEARRRQAMWLHALEPDERSALYRILDKLEYGLNSNLLQNG